MPESMDRQLITVAMFNASHGELKVAEELLEQVLQKAENDKSTDAVSYNLVLALNLYGRVLSQNPKRKGEAMDYLKQAEALL